jgi:hypothetical protein
MWVDWLAKALDHSGMLRVSLMWMKEKKVEVGEDVEEG